MNDYREKIAEVLTDYREGLLDSLEDGVDRIISLGRAYDAGRIDVTTVSDSERQFNDAYPDTAEGP